MSRLSTEEISAWGMTLYAALLPFHALGLYRLATRTGLELCDAVLALMAPAVAVELWRVRRRWLASPVVLGIIGLSGACLLAEAFEPRLARAGLIRSLLPIVAVGGVVTVVWNGKGKRLVRGLLLGGAFALVVAVLGYAVTLGSGPLLEAAFVFQSKHPVFSGLPRMTGTFGAHAVWLGEYCLMLLAVALGADEGTCSRKVRSGLAALAAVVLFATFSFAWLGGLLLLAQGFRASRALAGPPPLRTAIAFSILYVGASWLLLVGMPVDPQLAGAPQVCSSLDGAHHILRTGESSGVCLSILSDAPYPHRLTLYALAHRTALASYLAHPFLGLGHAGYRDFAIAYATDVVGPGEVGYYWAPVGLYASALAHGGTVGALGLALALFGVWRLSHSYAASREPAPHTPFSARGGWAFRGTLALLVTATQTDLELRGPLWVLLGLAVAEAARVVEAV